MNTWYQAAGNPSDCPPYNRLIISALRTLEEEASFVTLKLLQRMALDEIPNSGLIFRGDVQKHEADLCFLP